MTELSATVRPAICSTIHLSPSVLQTVLGALKTGKSLRIVRLVTQAKFKKLGYGRHMLKMLHRYFTQAPSVGVSSHVLLDTAAAAAAVHRRCEPTPLADLPKLLVDIGELAPAPFAVDYISCRFTASFDLLCFWKKCDFYPVRIAAISSSQMLCTMIRACGGAQLDKLDEAAYREMCETVGPVLLHDLRDVGVTLAHEILFHRNKFGMEDFKGNGSSLLGFSTCTPPP